MIKVTIAGICGRVGGAMLKMLPDFNKLRLVGGVEAAGHFKLGKEVYQKVRLTSDISEALSVSDVLIDFTSPEGTISNLKIAANLGKAVVIGTTGLNSDQLAEVRALSKKIPVLLSPNMSVGVNTMFKLVSDVKDLLGKDFKIDIVETHHVHKKDAPSGTAKKILEALGHAGDGVEIRSIREGEVVGDHTITFKSPYESLEITHRAFSRDVFASGALKAAEWIAGKKPGLYEMKDVLGL